MMTAIEIKVNGKALTVEIGFTILDLVRLLKLDTAQVAVELNQVIIPRSLHSKHVVRENDSIEIVEFVGGG